MRFEDIGRRIAARVIAAPVATALLFFVLASLATWRATELRLVPELSALLAANQPSVVEMKRALARTRGIANVFVVLEGNDPGKVRAFGDALVPKLLAIGNPWVGSAATGVQEARAFLLPRAGLFADTATLKRFRDELATAEQRAFQAAIGADFASEDGPKDEPKYEPPAPIFTPGALRERLSQFLGPKAEYAARYPDGYYQSRDGRTLIVVARSAVLPDDLPRAREAQRRIEAAVTALHTSGAYQDVRVSYAGDLITGLTEYGLIREDLLEVGLIGVALVLGIAWLFYLRVRALAIMGLTIAVGLALTFGVTELSIGSLNIATGFLFSIVAGNGINAGIILQSRYFEERRQRDALAAMRIAMIETARPTLAAALAAAGAYLALAATDFQAFRQFAFIGCVGMVICWAVTYGLLPALVIVAERIRPTKAAAAPRGLRFEAPFTALVSRAPRAITVLGVALGLVGLWRTVEYARADPLEYNLRRMENDRTLTGELYRASALAAEIVGARTEGAMLVLVDRLDQVAPLQAALRARRDAAPAGQKPFEEVHSLLDFVPPDQPTKLPLLAEIRRRLERAYDRGVISEADWEHLRPVLPPGGLKPFGAADLPEAVRRPFTERDGSVGRLLFIEPTAGRSDTDLRYLLMWADSFRKTRLPSGEVIHGSGRAVIYADLVGAVIANMPLALGLALVLTIAFTALTFARTAERRLVILAVVGALFGGLCLMGGAMAYFGLRIHFINFVALPITLGIGVDYALNLMSRTSRERGRTLDARVMAALRGTAGPVILCSLTTTLGYLALLRSRNQAVRSLGAIAVLGEVACLLAAILVLPAALRWWSSRRQDDSASPRATT